MQGDNDHVNWKIVICNNKASPKALFVTRLVLHGRLATNDKLYKWGFPIDSFYPLCNSACDSSPHLFFDCPFSYKI